MKLAVRILALSAVVAGATAASVSSPRDFASTQAVSAKLPIPMCGPHMPTCPTQPGPSVR